MEALNKIAEEVLKEIKILKEKIFEFETKYQRAHKGWVDTAKKLEQTNQNIKKFIEELKKLAPFMNYVDMNDKAYLETIEELTSKHFPQITYHNYQQGGDAKGEDKGNRVTYEKTQHSGEDTGYKTPSTNTQNISEVNNLGCGKPYKKPYWTNEIICGEMGDSGHCYLCPDCQSKQEKENGSTK